MEARDYIKVYWSQRGMILGVTLAVMAMALGWALTRPSLSAVSQSFSINRVNQAPTAQYEYDGYYALQAADAFSLTVVSWFRTPSILLEVYQQAGLDPEITSVDHLPARFSVKKYSAQNIVVRYSERTPERANKIAAVLPEVLSTKTGQLNQSASGKSLFAITGSTPVIAPAKPLWPMVGGLSLVIGFGLGLFAAAARFWLLAPESTTAR